MTRRSVPTRSGPRRSVHFRIADIRFFPSDTANDIETRLSKTLSELRRKNLGIDEDWFPTFLIASWRIRGRGRSPEKGNRPTSLHRVPKLTNGNGNDC